MLRLQHELNIPSHYVESKISAV